MDGNTRAFIPPADDAEFYARVRAHAGDNVALDDLDPGLVPEPPCDWCGGSYYVIERKRDTTILDDAGRVRPCPRCSAERRQINYERIGIKALITFDDWRDVEAMRPARKAIDDLLAKKRWAVLLSAGTGRGKTHLAIAAVHAFVQIGKGNALFRTAPELFEEMREAYDPSATYSLNSLIELYESRDLLVIDDLGSEYHKPTGIAGGVDWVDEKLFRIIDTRYQRKKRTLITTNLTPESDKIPARIRSRLSGCEVVVPGGTDYRGKQ